jgi:membrane protein YdbS with pleckstrin-like domain
MSNLLSLIYGPLDKSSCSYFLLLTLFFFVILIIAVCANIYVIIKNRKSLSFSNIVGALYMLFTLFIAYFVNRLMYTVCNKSFETS